jgi:peptidoglycan/LPS O-acetylase OafA/YrhL
VEEQFYLVLPLVLLAGVALRATRWQGWALLAGLTALGVGARGLLWQRYGLEADNAVAGYHPHLYYATLCRFDEFLPGVAVALIRHAHAPLWTRLMRHGQALLLAGLLACAAMAWALLNFYYFDGVGYGQAMTTWGYTLNTWAFALLVLAALSPRSWLARAKLPVAGPLALWSYSIYLSHKAVAHIVQQQFKSEGWPPEWLLPAVALASLGVGALLYRAVEAPCMAWRRRVAPSNFPVPSQGRLWRRASPQSSL